MGEAIGVGIVKGKEGVAVHLGKGRERAAVLQAEVCRGGLTIGNGKVAECRDLIGVAQGRGSVAGISRPEEGAISCSHTAAGVEHPMKASDGVVVSLSGLNNRSRNRFIVCEGGEIDLTRAPSSSSIE